MIINRDSKICSSLYNGIFFILIQNINLLEYRISLVDIVYTLKRGLRLHLKSIVGIRLLNDAACSNFFFVNIIIRFGFLENCCCNEINSIGLTVPYI